MIVRGDDVVVLNDVAVSAARMSRDVGDHKELQRSRSPRRQATHPDDASFVLPFQFTTRLSPAARDLLVCTRTTPIP